MKQASNLYHQVVAVTEDYFGPAASRFIDRQIMHHLNKQPEDLIAKDLTALIVWIQSAVSVLTDDRQVVNEFTERLRALTSEHRSNHGVTTR